MHGANVHSCRVDIYPHLSLNKKPQMLTKIAYSMRVESMNGITNKAIYRIIH